MMVTQKEIIRQLQAIMETKAFQKKHKSAFAKLVPKDEIISICEEELRNYMPEQIRDDIDFSHKFYPNKDTVPSIVINFEKVWRQSLAPEDYPRGADNIVLLFNNGYSTKNGATVYGYWDTVGEDVYSLANREPLYFLQKFVSDFNAKYGKKYNLTVTLSTVYDK